MHTSASLLDFHTRCHRTFAAILAHCQTLPAGVADKPLEHFAYPTLREQFHHVLGAERYWLGVLNGRIILDDDLAAFPDMAAIAAMRETVSAATFAFIRAASDEALNTPREVTTWGDRKYTLAPAHVLLRVGTHIYDHKGQLAAMCRTMNHPIPPGFDFPLR
jgi:uncharacterized damage-inducible protein DinB